MTARQRLLPCLAISGTLHLLLAVSANQGVGAAGGPRQPATHPAVSAFVVHRVSSRSNDDSTGAPTAPTPPSTMNVTVAAPVEPRPPQEEPPGEFAAEGVIHLPQPYYYPASQLEQRPHVTSDVQPKFPAPTDSARSGKVVLRLLVNEIGTVDRVLVERSELPDEYQESAVEAFSKAVLAPGEIGGRPVRSQMLIEVSFESGDR